MENSQISTGVINFVKGKNFVQSNDEHDIFFINLQHFGSFVEDWTFKLCDV